MVALLCRVRLMGDKSTDCNEERSLCSQEHRMMTSRLVTAESQGSCLPYCNAVKRDVQVTESGLPDIKTCTKRIRGCLTDLSLENSNLFLAPKETITKQQ